MAERGVILEIDGRHAIVLTRGGDFRRVRLDRPGRQVGEEIVLPARRRLPAGAMTVAAVAALLLLTLLPASLLRAPAGTDRPPAGGDGLRVVAPEVLAYVSVDINPSVELGVDGAARAVTARALNRDAAALLGEVQFAGRPVGDVIADLALAAARHGFLAADRENAVVIATVPTAPEAPLPEAVRQQVEAGRRRVEAVLAEQSLAGQVGVLNAKSPRLREEAERAGLSVGKYLILLEARQEGVQIAADEVREQPIGRLFQERGLKPGEVIRRAEREEDFERLAERFGPRARPGDEGDAELADRERDRTAPGSGGDRERGTGSRPASGERRRQDGQSGLAAGDRGDEGERAAGGERREEKKDQKDSKDKKDRDAKGREERPDQSGSTGGVPSQDATTIGTGSTGGSGSEPEGGAVTGGGADAGATDTQSGTADHEDAKDDEEDEEKDDEH